MRATTARHRHLAIAAALIAAVAACLWLVLPYGFPNYDTVYQLVWGNQLAHGVLPDYGAPLPPTPHPLAIAWGALVSPLGARGASDATTAVAYLSLGSIAYCVFALGSLWYDRLIGVVAAAFVLTRWEFLNTGLRGYVDLPFVALLLAALLIEARRRRAGSPVLAVLAAAGLLRPEGWLFAAAYVAYLAAEPGFRGRRAVVALVLLAAAPVLWVAFDWSVTGHPLYSLTGTRTAARSLGRDTGLHDLVVVGPHRLAQVMQVPALVAAAAGIAFGAALMPRRVTLGLVATVLAGLSFAILGVAGLPLQFRYLLPASALLTVFCAVGLLGWRLLEPGHPGRRVWQLVAILAVLVLAADGPRQYRFAKRDRSDLIAQSRVESDLRRIVQSNAFERGCMPVAVPNHRGVPRTAAWRDIRPTDVVSIEDDGAPASGYLLYPRTADASRHFSTTQVPDGFREVASNRSWLLYRRC
jgi:hypothetical protein